MIRALFLFLVGGSWAIAADYYVAKSGSDSNPGSETQPWRTIQKAADTLAPGDTAWVRGGVYKERVTVNVSGAGPDRFVTLRAFPEEKVVIDGSKFTPPRDADSAMVWIEDKSYVRIQGFTIRNYRATKGDIAIFGVFIKGECENVEIRDNNIHRIRYRSRRGNAFGLAVYGTSAAKPVSRVIIDNNEIHHCKLGNSESLSLNGNVVNCEVTNNRVHDNDNIGIVFIGFEGTCPDPVLDQARDCICRGNTVWNISSYGNPAYGKQFAAGGIYVDGGRRILIERNTAFRCDIGVELASEHENRATSEVELRENFVYRNRVGGLFMGGYDELRGRAENCFIHHNTFSGNDRRKDGNGEVAFFHYVSGNTITHNIFAAGQQGLLMGNPTLTNSSNVLDYNLYFAPAGVAESEWQWLKMSVTGFDAYRSATGNDTHSIFADPMFVDTAAFDLRLAAGSPAVDAGASAFVPGDGETDFDGEPRVKGARTDIGADEL